MILFVIGGKARAGKNTFGELLKKHLKDFGYNACVMKITEPLYEYAKNYFDWDGRDASKPREFLQKLGIEVIQEKMGKKDFLLNRLYEDIEILDNFFDVGIITDARLVHEFEELKNKYSSITIKVVRDNYNNDLTEDEKKHITETDLDNYKDFDYLVLNNNMDSLDESALKIVNDVFGK